MSEHPIIFSGPMVRAILNGRKAQTRRVVRKPERMQGLMMEDEAADWCPYGGPGDRLWVRETFAIECNAGCQELYTEPREPLGVVRYFGKSDIDDAYFECARYRASEPDTILGDYEDGMKWKPSIHMPRWASRITLEVVAVRVERVQEISEEEAESEGVHLNSLDLYTTFRDGFRILWSSINGKKPGRSWADNPWVWVVEFAPTTQ